MLHVSLQSVAGEIQAFPHRTGTAAAGRNSAAVHYRQGIAVGLSAAGRRRAASVRSHAVQTGIRIRNRDEAGNMPVAVRALDKAGGRGDAVRAGSASGDKCENRLRHCREQGYIFPEQMGHEILFRHQQKRGTARTAA